MKKEKDQLTPEKEGEEKQSTCPKCKGLGFSIVNCSSCDATGRNPVDIFKEQQTLENESKAVVASPDVDENTELEKLFVDFKNHLKNKEFSFRHKKRNDIADVLQNKNFLDYGSEFFIGGYMAAFDDLKRIGKI